MASVFNAPNIARPEIKHGSQLQLDEEFVELGIQKGVFLLPMSQLSMVLFNGRYGADVVKVDWY